MILVRYTPNSEHLFSLMIDVPENINRCVLGCIFDDGKYCLCKDYDDAMQQCEDSAIGIDNPEVLPFFPKKIVDDPNGFHGERDWRNKNESSD